MTITTSNGSVPNAYACSVSPIDSQDSISFEKTNSVAPSPYGIVEKVEEIVPSKVIRVTFLGGDVQKAVCCDEDEFDFERGIEVCICKHLLGGTKEFNKQIKKALKCYDDAVEKELDELMEENRIKVKKEKRAEQKKRREERRMAEEIERQIQIQTGAILRANKILKGETDE